MFEVIINKVSNKWILEIFDNGTNGSEPGGSRDMGLGLKSIHSRVASIKGKLIIENRLNCYYIKIII
jgi:signal transduction histidine kinase